MRRLDRYVLGEILGPLALGFFLYTFILLLRVFFRSADLIIRSDVAPETIGQLLLLSLPNIVVLTIPMSFLFAILIAVGRLSSDSELVAIRASGVSLFSLYRPILFLSAILAGINLYLMIVALPSGNYALQRLQVEIMTQGISEEVQPRVPHTGWEDQMLYVFEAPPGDRLWKGVFLTDAIPAGETQIHVAEWGEARASQDGSSVVLSLSDVVTHRVDLNQPETYNAIRHKEIEIALATIDPAQAAVSVKRGLREMPLRELRRTMNDPETSPTIRNLAEVELHKKFSIPFACLVFGLLGLPLGFTNSRGGRSSGFAISIGVILVYYILLNWGEDFAKKGSAPAEVTVWLPNLLLLTLGLILLARRNRDKSLVLTKLDKWIREHLWRHLLRLKERRDERRRARRDALEETLAARRAAGHTSVKSSMVLRLPRFQLRFPNSIDRYILATFFRVLAIASATGLTVYIAADLTENAESILKNDVSLGVVLDYYKYRSFSIFYEISPIIALVTTLVSFGLLSRTNEIIALKALGLSLYRLALPVLVAAAGVAGFCWLLQMDVLAASNQRVLELKATIKGKASAMPGRRADERWLYSNEGRYLYNFTHYDEKRQELQRLQVFKFDEAYRLTDRLMVDRATYLEDEDRWELQGGWARSFEEAHLMEYLPFEEVLETLPEPPEFFRGAARLPEQMSFHQLRDYISDLKEFGNQDTAPLEVEMHNKLAYPALAFVMTLVALPFAFRLGRQGALYGIGLSLVLGMVLLLFLSFFKAMGNAAMLPPVVAMWSPSVIFSIFALYLFLGVRT